MELCQIYLIFPAEKPWRLWEGIEISLYVTPLGNNIFRLEDVSALIPLQFHDEFEAIPATSQVRALNRSLKDPDEMELLYHFQSTHSQGHIPKFYIHKRVRKSGFKSWTVMTNGHLLENTRFIQELEKLVEAGGQWAIEWEVMFSAAWPQHFDPTPLKSAICPSDIDDSFLMEQIKQTALQLRDCFRSKVFSLFQDLRRCHFKSWSS